MQTGRYAHCIARLAYSAAQHGWSSSAFHEQVNTFGATVILAQTAGGALCGGYNPRGWIGEVFLPAVLLHEVGADVVPGSCHPAVVETGLCSSGRAW